MKRLIVSSFILLLSAGIYCAAETNPTPNEQKVLIKTSAGDIVVKLYDATPLHRDNFIKLVKSNFYDSLLFHRVISSFMIQGGDPKSKNALPDQMLGDGGPGYKIPAEFRTPEIFHKKGVLAAAREGDNVNPEKASSGSQFYIVVGKTFEDKDLDLMQLNKKQKLRSKLFQQIMDQKQPEAELYNKEQNLEKLKALKDSISSEIESKINADKNLQFTNEQRNIYKTVGGTPHLDGNYTVFGEVVQGMDVVEKISTVKTNSKDRPLEDIRIIKMILIK